MCAEFYSIKLIFCETVLHQSPCSIFANEPREIGYVTSQKIQRCETKCSDVAADGSSLLMRRSFIQIRRVPTNSQNNRVWSKGKKCQVAASRLLDQRAKFAPHLMVSAGVCFE